MEKEKNEVALIDEQTIQGKIYLVRGQKVMLDVDLAEIYGYETKNFNRQVKNNLEKFDGEDFMFQLTNEEVDELSRCKNCTLNRGSQRGMNIKYNPHAFTEQGIYMLMTVLRGELATKQSRALVRTFKKMKDYIIENQGLTIERDFLKVSLGASNDYIQSIKYQSNLQDVEDKIVDVVNQLNKMLKQSEISKFMKELEASSVRSGYLVLNGQPFKADVAYDEIYTQAKKSIYIVDNYIGIKTLELLINVSPDVKITIFSDNLTKGLRQSTYADFRKEYPNLQMSLCTSGGIFHDRYIILDYGAEDEKIFHCGASSKNAGEKVTSILEDPDTNKYHGLVDELLKNEMLKLS